MLTRSYQPEHEAPLPRWACLALALACIALGVWASVITLRYFEHGAAALEGDETTRSLAIAAALMFVCLEMAAFGLAALLTWRAIRGARWKLAAFAGAVLAFECATIILVQHAITRGADLHAGASTSRAAELRASMEAQRATAAGLRENAARQSASQFRQSRDAGAQALRESLAIERSLREQAAELATLETARKPTTTEILGETGALAYAVARGLLVSMGGLVMFGAAGALLRAARGPVVAAPGAAHDAGGGADALRVLGDAPALPAAAPGALPEVAKVVPIKRGDGRWALAAGAGLAAFAAASPSPAQAAPMAHQATVPATGRGLPTAAPLRAAGASELTQAGASEVTHHGAPTRAHHEAGEPGGSASELTHPGASEVTHHGAPARAHHGAGEPGGSASELTHQANPEQARPAKAKRTQQRAQVVDGSRRDTGTGDADGHRFLRVKRAVLAGKMRPSMRAIQERENAGAPVARRYLAQLEAEGVIERAGRVFVLVKRAA